jgi:membrane-associated HD superfamily phosphohydrolase
MGERVAAFVREHHGTSLMRLLQAKAMDQAAALPTDDGAFRYPGPRPRTKETGILMVADQVEATARSAPPPDMAACQDIVHRTIARIQAEGELSESGLSPSDIASIELALVRSVHAMYHRRLTYPSLRPPLASGSAARH